MKKDQLAKEVVLLLGPGLLFSLEYWGGVRVSGNNKIVEMELPVHEME